MEIEKQIEKVEQLKQMEIEKIEQFKPMFDDRINNSGIEDNINRFSDDSVKNFTRAIVNNSGSGNVSVVFYDDKKKSDDDYQSSAIKISKTGIVVNLMLLISLFLNM